MRTDSSRLLLVITTAIMLCACSDSSDSNGNLFRLQGCADTGTCAPNPTLVIGGDRPAMVRIPSNYDYTRRYPLIVVLHGRGADGYIQALYFGLFDRAERYQYVLVYPDGRALPDDPRKQWPAAPTCCDTTLEEAEEVSDVPYLTGLIEEAAATYSIDVSRIGLIGHSSGGFMSYTMACEASHLVTAIVNLAGSTFVDLDLCRPATERVSVLSVHGDRDDTVFYEGVENGYLSAPAAAARYAMLAGCDPDDPEAKPALDIVANLDGAETSRIAWPGCLSGTEVEFWTINDGPHIPGPWRPEGLDLFVEWLLEHSRD